MRSMTRHPSLSWVSWKLGMLQVCVSVWEFLVASPPRLFEMSFNLRVEQLAALYRMQMMALSHDYLIAVDFSETYFD